MKKYTRLHIPANDDGAKILKGKTIKDVAYHNDSCTSENYIAVTFTDNTYTLIGIGEDEYSHIFKNLTLYDEEQFYRTCKCGYKNANGDFVYTKSIQKLIDLGIFQRDKEKEDLIERHYRYNLRLENYNTYLRTMYEVEKDENTNFVGLTDVPYTNEELYSVLSNMSFYKNTPTIIIVRNNPFYDEFGFSFDTEMKRKDLVEKYNPYFLFDEFKQTMRTKNGVNVDINISPIYINYIQSLTSDTPGEWYANHLKLYQMTIGMKILNPSDLINDTKDSIVSFHIKDEKIKEIIEEYKDAQIFWLCK